MKKYLILLLVVVMIFSLGACKKKENVPEGENGGTVEVPEVTGEDLFADRELFPNGGDNTLVGWMNGGAYYVRFTMESTLEGETSSSRGAMARQGNNVMMFREAEFDEETLKTRVIVRDGMSYIVNDVNKTYSVSNIGIEDTIADYSKMRRTGKGSGTVNGKSLPYVEYVAGSNRTRFYMENGEVHAIEEDAGDGVLTVMVIEEASREIPSGTFEVPDGYMRIEM